MNRGPLVFLGTFFALATSWLGFVLMPQLQIGRQSQVESKDNGQMYPLTNLERGDVVKFLERVSSEKKHGTSEKQWQWSP